MNNRVIPALLCAAALAFACGPHPHTSAQSVTTAATTTDRPARRVRPAPMSESMIGSSLHVRVADAVTFTLRVTNTGPKLVQVSFPSGQTHDVMVVDSSGREVWRWSEGRMFTQSLQTKQVAAGESVDYDAAMPRADLHGGTYTAIATLRSSTHPSEQREVFTLP